MLGRDREAGLARVLFVRSPIRGSAGPPSDGAVRRCGPEGNGRVLNLISDILTVTAPFFALIACGYIARRTGVMIEGSTKVLNDFVLFFALPALLIRTIANIPLATLFDPDVILLWASVGVLMFVLTAIAAALLFREQSATAIIEAAIATLGNVGYLGLTLVIGLLGAQSTAFVTMAIIVDMVVIIPLTIGLLGLFANGDGGVLGRIAAALKAAIFNPFVAAIAGGVFLSAIEFAPPPVVDSFLRTLGAAAVPTALFAIGASLHGRSISSDGVRMSSLVALKLVAHPLAILAVGIWLMDLEPWLVAAGVLLAALPTANNVFLIAMRNNVHPEVVSGAIVASTIAAVISFNAWALIVRDW